jgi:2-haloacid dehalogenase
MTEIDYERFSVLTFDCYGTLVDWEAGLLAAFHAAHPAGWPAADEELLERYAAHEATVERGPYRPYRELVGEGLRAVAAEYGMPVSAEAVVRFGESVRDWPPFPDSADALRRLAGRFNLGVITNCDDDLFEASRERLGVRFAWVVTAQQVGSYKPSRATFEAAFAAIGRPREQILHVAQSLFHDHVPAKALGLTTVWIDRRGDRPGSGATPPADATPDATFPSMASFAAAAAP